MPVVCVEVPEGFSTEKKSALRLAVKQAVLDTLAPKETKYDYVAIREVFGESKLRPVRIRAVPERALANTAESRANRRILRFIFWE